MTGREYPLHDINKVFDMFEEDIKAGGCADNAMEEMLLLNKLFASLPPEAVEYAMMFLHGNKDLPSSCDEIMPLFVRFLSLAEYLEKIASLKEVPAKLDNDFLTERQETIASLPEHEKAFGMPILGFRFSQESNSVEAADEKDEEEEEGSGALHLMNASAAVFVCEDPLKTALFYETKCGFKASHLEDEKMPHIRLKRDNIAIVLAKGKKQAVRPLREMSDVLYDMYIYATEPYMLHKELEGAGVKIVEELQDANEAVRADTNRQFVFEDCDRRHICVSQSSEMV